MLCDKCSNIHFKRIEDCELIQQEPERLQGEDSTYNISGCVFYIHHKDKNALELSADQGCHFCGMLWGSLFRGMSAASRQSKYRFARGEIILRRSVVESWIEKEGGLEAWNKCDWIYIQCGERNVTTTSVSEYSGLIGAMLECLTTCANIDSLELFRMAPQTNAISGVIDKGELEMIPTDLWPTQNSRFYSPWLDTSTISPANLALASVWMKNCLQNHGPCRKAQTKSILPRRIIDISDPQHPFIDDGQDREDQYVTLSYKWGEGSRYVTTTQNLSDHKKEIPLKGLPWTFREAVHVAYGLGFRWLWIDALCILQDSKEDQASEMSMMDQIFRFSTLTLLAAAGDNTDAGLSVTRDPRWVKPCRLNLQTTLDAKTVDGQSYITIDYDGPFIPLFTRGWVLQEQVLATRGLVFGASEVTWRCLCGYSTENAPSYQRKVETWQELGSPQHEKWRSYSSGWDGFDTLRMWLLEENPVPDRTPWQRDNQFDHWYTLVTEYCRRYLSYTSDILPALSGLASSIARQHRCTYLAGIWKEDLQIGLLWYVTGQKHGPEASDGLLGEESFDFPSWSWASQWGKLIAFRKWENNSSQIKHEGVVFQENLNQNRITVLNPFGTVIQMALTLTGRVRTALVDRTPSWRQRMEYDEENKQWSDENGQWVSIVKDAVSGRTIGQIALDSDPTSVPVELIHCLLCTVREKYGKWQLSCLALVPTDMSYEEFTRVGLVFMRQEDWFGHLEISKPDTLLGRRRSMDTRFIRTVRVV